VVAQSFVFTLGNIVVDVDDCVNVNFWYVGTLSLVHMSPFWASAAIEFYNPQSIKDGPMKHNDNDEQLAQKQWWIKIVRWFWANTGILKQSPVKEWGLKQK